MPTPLWPTQEGGGFQDLLVSSQHGPGCIEDSQTPTHGMVTKVGSEVSMAGSELGLILRLSIWHFCNLWFMK